MRNNVIHGILGATVALLFIACLWINELYQESRINCVFSNGTKTCTIVIGGRNYQLHKYMGGKVMCEEIE